MLKLKYSVNGYDSDLSFKAICKIKFKSIYWNQILSVSFNAEFHG
jgi:hypothetical protein